MTKISQPEASNFVAATAMFVEVLVVGIGSLTALAIFGAAAAGYRNVKDIAPIFGSTPASGAAIAFSYALGILVDRAADSSLTSARRRLRSQHFTSNAAYDQARRAIVRLPDLVARADYARSRMRICRGWFFNSILLIAATDLALVRFPVQDRLLLISLATTIGILMASGFYAAWKSITVTGYRKLAQQSQVSDPDSPATPGVVATNQAAGDAQPDGDR
ncbi:hypothetical protein [Streptomyces sp. NPDC050355]|uniref:hypothetical protein n=1 Tax=Streptomyces sp. NPDC050355 TaxID=3365609 RepID=UPI0037A12C47